MDSLLYNAILAALLLPLVALGLWLWLRRRARGGDRRALERLLADVSVERLSEVVVPDGNDGEIQLGEVLLTSRGIVVMDVKQVRGHVFGSDRMDDWTVIDGDRRFTFVNPQGPLHDRVAAVRRIVRDVPVEGLILFGTGARFGGELPRHVTTLEQFRERFSVVRRNELRNAVEAFYPHWEQLCDAVQDARLQRLAR